jgi:hypothetical protein
MKQAASEKRRMSKIGYRYQQVKLTEREPTGEIEADIG